MPYSARLLACVVAAVGLLGLLPWGGRPLVHREQELRVIVTARDMARGGSWLIPSYLGEPRFNKPPLMYWVSAGWFKLTGTEPRPALARLPNAVLGTGLLLALFTLGMPLVGRRRAFLAALTAGTCPLFLRFGRLCETDIPFAFCEAVSMLMLYGAIRAPHRLHRWLISGLAAGIGFMIKGPAAIILPLAACGAFLLTSPPASRKAFRPARMGLWLLVVAVIGCPWYVFIFLSQASQAAAGDVGYELGALLRHSEHQGTPGFYLYTLPVALLPWGVLLPFAVVHFWRAARRHATIRFLLAWLLSSLLIMSLVKSKQIHYATLLLAPSALLTGCYLSPLFARRPTRRARALHLYGGILNTLFAVAGVLCMLLPLHFAFLQRGPCLVLGGLTAAVSLAGLLAPVRQRAAARMGSACLAILMVTALYAWQLSEISEPSRMVKSFAAQTRAHLRDSTNVFLAGELSSAMRYYMDAPIVAVPDLAQGWSTAGTGDLVILVSHPGDFRPPQEETPPPVLVMEQGTVSLRLFVKTAGQK